MIVSLYCSNGRVGKTTTTLALAHEAQTNWGIKTCVLEFDFSPGDISAILGLDSAKNILDAADGDFDLALQKPSNEDFYVITAGYPDYLEQLKSQDIINILTTLDDEFELVLVDIQPNFAEQMIDILNLSSKIVLVINNEEQDVTRLLSHINWGIKSNFMSEDKFEILINKFNKKDKINFIEESKMQYPILTTIPNIKNFKGYCDDRFGRYMSELLDIFFPELAEVSNKNKKGGLFSNIFKTKKKKINKSEDILQLPPPSNKTIAEPKPLINLNNNIPIKKGDGDNNMLDLDKAFNNDKKQDIFSLANKPNEVSIEVEDRKKIDTSDETTAIENGSIYDNSFNKNELNTNKEIELDPSDISNEDLVIEDDSINNELVIDREDELQIVSGYESNAIYKEERELEGSIDNSSIGASANIFNVQEMLNKFISESNVKINSLIKENEELKNHNKHLANSKQDLDKAILELKNRKINNDQSICNLENDNKLNKEQLYSLQNKNRLLIDEISSKDQYIDSLNKELLDKESEYQEKAEEIKKKITELNLIL